MQLISSLIQGETRIEVVMQSAITVSLNLKRNSVEVNHIAIYMMGVLHAEMIELVLGIGNGVVWTERGVMDRFSFSYLICD